MPLHFVTVGARGFGLERQTPDPREEHTAAMRVKVKRAEPASQRKKVKRVVPRGRPLALVNAFIDEARELQGHSFEYRQFLTQSYTRVFDKYPHDSLFDQNIYFRVAYELTVRGYRAANVPIPEVVKRRYHKSIQFEEENIMSPKAAAEKQKQHFTLKGRAVKRRPGVRTILAELLVENHKNKFTDKKILIELKKMCRKLKINTRDFNWDDLYQVQWMRGYIMRNLKKYNLSENAAKRRLRRFDEKGNDITNQHRKKVKRAKPAPEPKKAKRTAKKPEPPKKKAVRRKPTVAETNAKARRIARKATPVARKKAARKTVARKAVARKKAVRRAS